jgi:hypothetical protein
MTFRSLVSNVFTCVGTALCVLTVVVAFQQNAQASKCPHCVGCTSSGTYTSTGILICNGGCLDPGITSVCDNTCGCTPDQANLACNCR